MVNPCRVRSVPLRQLGRWWRRPHLCDILKEIGALDTAVEAGVRLLQEAGEDAEVGEALVGCLHERRRRRRAAADTTCAVRQR